MVVRLKHANITMPDIDAAIAFLKANPSDRTRSPVCVIIHAGGVRDVRTSLHMDRETVQAETV